MKNAPVRHALEYVALWPFLRLLRVLPHGASRALGAGLGGLAHALDGHRRRVALDTPGGFERNRTGSTPPRNCTPWCSDGRKPEPQSRV